MKRKITLVLAAAVAMTTMALNVSADASGVSIVLDGATLETEQPAVILEGSTLVPVRDIVEAFGCEVNWDAETKTVEFTKGDVSATLVVGAKEVTVTMGEVSTTVEIGAPATIINNRTMVPVRFLSGVFGVEVDWDAETKTVILTTGADVVESGSAVESGAAVETEEVEVEEVEEVESEEAEAEADEEETTVEETTVEETTVVEE